MPRRCLAWQGRIQILWCSSGLSLAESLLGFDQNSFGGSMCLPRMLRCYCCLPA